MPMCVVTVCRYFSKILREKYCANSKKRVKCTSFRGLFYERKQLLYCAKHFFMINISKLKYREGLLCNKGIEVGQNVNDYNVELPILKFCYLIYVIKR